MNTAFFYTYGSEILALILAQHNWEHPLTVELSLPTDINRAKASTVESRRAFAANARYSLGYRVLLDDPQASTELRIFLLALQDETVAAPMWADWIETTQVGSIGQTSTNKTSVMPVRFGSEWIAIAPDASVFEIVTVSLVSPTKIDHSAFTLAWPTGTRMYPLIFGRLTEYPKAEAVTDEAIDAPLKIKENSAFARRLSTPAQTPRLVGSHIVDFAGVSLWDIPPTWDAPKDSVLSDVEFYSVGFQREEQIKLRPSPNARTLDLGYLQQGRDEILRIEWLWRDRRGPVRPFMIPTWRGDMVITINLPIAGHTDQIFVEPTEFTDPARAVQPGDPYIAMIDPDGTVDPFKLGIVGGTTLNIADGVVVTAPHLAGQAKLSHLLYARLAEPTLKWNYETDAVAQTRLSYQELPNEINYYNAHAGLPANLVEPGFLYVFTEQKASPLVSRFTSYESAVVVGSGVYAGTYVPAPYSFGSIKSGIRLAQEKCEITSAPFTGNPLAKFYPFAFDGVLEIEILEVDVNSVTTPKVRFYGDVWEVDPTTYKATCLFLGRFFERRYPNFLLSTVDNGTPDTAALSITGPLATSVGQVIKVTSTPANAKPANWFAEGGYIDTADGERRSILHSTPITSPAVGVQLSIDRPLLGTAIGHNVTMVPGYDGSIDERDTKFSDRNGFLAHPYIPDTNPMVKAMKAVQVDGGKK